MNSMYTADILRQRQALPLAIKITMTKLVIRAWMREFGEDGTYISFSGGKDSTLLLNLVREDFPKVPAVFINTGLEYPEIQQFVKTFDNVEILRPKMRFDDVIKTYGYPIISKSVANCVRGARNGSASRIHLLNGLNCDGSNRKSKFSKLKYRPLLDVDFLISDRCCDVMKKSPAHEYARRTGRKPIFATMADESMLREKAWLQNGCNAFNAKEPHSAPMSFWTQQDVLQYIAEQKLPIASVYGDIVKRGKDGYDYTETLCDGCGEYHTTGCDRTGCIFCGFGAGNEKGEGRFVRLKRTHPRQYEYCMEGGAYDADGMWKPTKEGLGMRHVLEVLNKIYGQGFVKF